MNVSSPAGEPFGADAAMCSCGSAVLTPVNTQVKGNGVSVDVLDTADSGPSGPGALEVDSDATIANVRFTGNSTRVAATSGDAGALGALLFLFDGQNPPTISNGSISDNVTTATAANGAATFAQGGGIWNGQLFGGPESPVTLVATQVKDNVLVGGAGVTLEGGGIFTPGFPLTLVGSVVRHNAPDDCVGC